MKNSSAAPRSLVLLLASSLLACHAAYSPRPAVALVAAASAADERAVEAGAATQTPPAREPAAALKLPELVPEITARELEAHVRFLASDELAGRGTGTPEGLRAAQYLAGVLRACGVAPAGDDGTFLQRVELERSRATAAPEFLVTPKSGTAFQASYGADFRWPASLDQDTPPLRVVIVRTLQELPREPDPSAALFMDMSRTDRRRALTRRDNPGAVGWGLLLAPGRDKAGQPLQFEEQPWSPIQRGGPGRRDQWLELHGPLLERVRKGEITVVQLTTHVERQPVDAFNVVGIVPGAGENELAQEAVVLSAHYDHLPPRGGGHGHADEGDDADGGAKPADKPRDVIFNGADDDASGCAAVLELAGALAHRAKPARSVVFLLATGEEIGLLGTEAYLDAPRVPLAKTVANLNFEMIGRPDAKVGGAGVLWFTGFELSNLGAAFEAAKLPIKADPRPDQHFFERSDNIAFVRRGVVGQTFSTYDLHADYHTVRDEADQLDYAHMETCVRASLPAVELVTGGALRPAWLAGRDPNAPTDGR